MKFTCQQKIFLEALSIVQKAINSQTTLPILGNVLLKVEGQKLYLSATNLEIAISTTIPVDVKNEGKITIPAKFLLNYIALLKDGEIEINLEDGKTISFHSQGVKTKIKGISADEFPVIPKVEKEENFTIPTVDLKNSIEEIVFCCATSTTRPVLSGVYLWGKDGQIKLVATDSYRLGEKTITLSGKKFETELKNIIPARTMQELARILSATEEEKVEVISSKNQILFRVGNIELISRLIEGKFPEYTQIIPTEAHTQVTVSTDEFTLGIKRVGLFARENNYNIRYIFTSNKVILTTDATEIGSEESEIPAEFSGEENQVILNGNYLLDVLQNIRSEKVLVKMKEKLSPVVITPEKESGLLHVIMPLKL